MSLNDRLAAGWKHAIKDEHQDGDGLMLPQTGRWVLGWSVAKGEFYIKRDASAWYRVSRRLSWCGVDGMLYVPTLWRPMTTEERSVCKRRDIPGIPWSLLHEVNGVLMFKEWQPHVPG